VVVVDVPGSVLGEAVRTSRAPWLGAAPEAVRVVGRLV